MKENSTNPGIKRFSLLLTKEDKESLSKFVKNQKIPEGMSLTLETLMTDKQVNFGNKEAKCHSIEVETTKNSKNLKHGLKIRLDQFEIDHWLYNNHRV